MRLGDLDPSDVADEALGRLTDHIAGISFGLMPAVPCIPLPEFEELRAAQLHHTVRALTVYAQRGLPVWDWTDLGMAVDGLLEVFVLWRSPMDASASASALDLVDDVDPADAVSLVVVAAGARIRLAQGSPVTTREVGALAGIGAAAVRHYTRAGELASTGRGKALRVPAEDAVRWLAARGVEGL